MKLIKGLLENFTMFVMAILLVSTIGCEKDSLFTPSTDADSVQPKFLKSKRLGFNKPFSKQQFILASAGGTILVGDESSGYSELIFSPGDLPQDTVITFEWDSRGYITDLLPHGIEFNGPVELKLSYKDADLTNVNEEELKIWYNRENTNWELIGGDVDIINKRVEGAILHFSRYAIGEMP